MDACRVQTVNFHIANAESRESTYLKTWLCTRSIELYCIVFVSRYLDLEVTLGQWGKTVLGTYNILGLCALSCFL